MKEITKNQATAIWQIFFVLWLTVGSIVCFNIHCITSEPPIYAPMFAITPLYLIEFYFDHPYTVQAILFQNFVLILMPALLWFLTYKSVFKNKKSANTIILILMIPDTVLSAFYGLFFTKGGEIMKNNKTLKYTGIIQGVLIATLLLLAIWIQVTFLYNTYYCEDYSFDFLRNMGIGYWDLRNNSSVFFLINSIAETIAYFLDLMHLYVLKIIFQIIAAAALTLPVILGYLSIFRKNIVANGLIIAGSALTLLSACRSLFSTLFELARGFGEFTLVQVVLIIVILIKIELIAVSLLRIKQIKKSNQLQ